MDLPTPARRRKPRGSVSRPAAARVNGKTARANGKPARANGKNLNGNGAGAGADDVNMRKLLRALQAVRDGDFSVRMPSDQTGLTGKVADTFNEIVAANQRMARELERAGQTVGKDGRLDGAAFGRVGRDGRLRQHADG
jgi:hypothetical protein